MNAYEIRAGALPAPRRTGSAPDPFAGVTGAMDPTGVRRPSGSSGPDGRDRAEAAASVLRAGNGRDDR